MQRKKLKEFNVKRSVFLLLLVAVFLILATYAWFTSNTLVKIETIEVSVETSAGFQISVDAVNWKSVISPSDILGTGGGMNYWTAHNNHIPSGKYMAPVSTVGAVDTGKLKMFLGIVDVDENTGILELTAEQVADAKLPTYSPPTIAPSQTECPFIAFDVFFRVNQGTYLYLDVDSNVIGKPDAALINTRGLENATRVAFVVQGHESYADYDADLDYSITRAMSAASNIVIWEPNSNHHTIQSISDARNSYGKTITAGSKFSPYAGVLTDITTGLPLTNAAHDTSHASFGPVPDGLLVSLLQTDKPYAGGALADTDLGDGQLDNALDLGIELQPGITKVRIYMWIEGQDYDCQDFASGVDNLAFNLAFTIDGTIPVTPPSTDAGDVAAAKTLIGSTITVSDGGAGWTTGDEALIAAAAETEINLLSLNGVVATVAHDSGTNYIVTLTKNLATDTINPFAITVIP